MTSLFTPDDLHYFSEGTHGSLSSVLGSHPGTVGGVAGTTFSVWAPNAESVSVIGDWNGWDSSSAPLSAVAASGIWEGFVPGAGHGARYKYLIVSHNGGYRVEKADPMALCAEEPPLTASVVWSLDYAWGDADWMATRGERNALSAPMSVYEVHLGSWRRSPDDPRKVLGYRDLAPLLIEHVTRLGFTHVELLPVMEHPFYGSWGYQTTGYFAPTRRYGDPEDFMWLVDQLHQAGVGVILDWVPSHFPNDEHGLAYFDGTHLYEHADPRQGFHPDWKSAIFNYGRNEVRSFLTSSASHWLDRYHADGIRVDAVASMLYLDYSRREGEWIPNAYGGRENNDAIQFLQRLNAHVYATHPDVQMIAEESTSWPMVSRPTDMGGLGFGLKWDMGWMHDTLEYFKNDPVHRRHHQSELTFRALYAFTENFMLPLSHDEVVHGKGSLYAAMPGDQWQKFANLRLLYGYMYACSGKKLLFMGDEFGQQAEWTHEASLDWHELDHPFNAGLMQFVGDLNRTYCDEPALHDLDVDASGFEWVDAADNESSALSFIRRGANGETVLCVFNLTPVPRTSYRIGVPREGAWRELVNSDAVHYGGSGQGNLGGVEALPVPMHGRRSSVLLTLPPLSVILLRHEGPVILDLSGLLGATRDDAERFQFRVWAPRAARVELHLLEPERVVEMEPSGRGYFSAITAATPGTVYGYRLDDGDDLPDPASRSQPYGVHGPSAVVDPGAFAWTDGAFRAPPLSELVIYELHVGTFSEAGTFDGAIDRLDDLVALGVNACELMPVAQFPGARNWGYDGVDLWAPQSSYGGPDGLRRLVDACHARGLAVVLDVVYNHFGPEGNYLERFGPYLTDRHHTPWGQAVNVDGPESDEVRRFLCGNALHWLDEYHIDALRLDAIHGIVDTSAVPFLRELADAVRDLGARRRRTLTLIAESDLNDPRVTTPATVGGLGLASAWCDDVHHAVHAALTGEREGYYADFGTLADLAKALRQGFVYDGRFSEYRRRRQGAPPVGLDGQHFVVFAQNHDQVGNRALGDRLSQIVDLERQKLAAGLVLLSPFVPLLFMGEEYGETAPFLYFTDHGDEQLNVAVREGRAREFAAFARTGELLDPHDPEAFARSQLDWTLREHGHHRQLLDLYRELLALRRDLAPLARRSLADASVTELDDAATLLLRRSAGAQEILVAFHLGEDESPPIALPDGTWEPLLDSASARFGGPGDAWRQEPEGVRLAPCSFVVFRGGRS